MGVGFGSVLMSAMTDLNLCTYKLPKNFLCRRLQAKLSEWKNVLHIKLLNQQILHARDVVRAGARAPGPPRIHGVRGGSWGEVEKRSRDASLLHSFWARGGVSKGARLHLPTPLGGRVPYAHIPHVHEIQWPTP